jgi:hypothetical protein
MDVDAYVAASSAMVSAEPERRNAPDTTVREALGTFMAITLALMISNSFARV